MTMAFKAAQNSDDELWVKDWKESFGERTIRERSKVREGVELVFFSSWFCPFAQRAWIALEEKQLNYRWVEINPYEVNPREPGGYTKKQLPLQVKRELYPDFIEASPRGLVPALNNQGEKVWESAVVVEYLEEKFPDGPSFMPKDPHQRAMVRIWADHCTNRIQKSFYTMLMAQDMDQQVEARETFFDECRSLARAMAPTGVGPFFLGEDFSMVDIVLAPFWQRFLWIGSHYRGLSFPNHEAEFSRLDRWWNAVQVRPAVKSTFVCEPRLIASYSQYSRNEGTSDYAKNLQSSIRAKE